MSVLQQSNQIVHYSFYRFLKLVHLSNILRSVDIKKIKGVKIVTLLEWLIRIFF